jgi:hypothetical protein
LPLSETSGTSVARQYVLIQGGKMRRTDVRVVTSILIAPLICSCGAVNYDAQADQQLTTLTQETNQQFITWESQAIAKTPVVYDTKFYDKVEADIKTLEIRMEASQDPATQNLISVFDSLNSQIESLRALHMKQKSFNDAPFLKAESDLINVQLAALITFELSLKSNATDGSSNLKAQSTSPNLVKNPFTANAIVTKTVGQ